MENEASDRDHCIAEHGKGVFKIRMYVDTEFVKVEPKYVEGLKIVVVDVTEGISGKYAACGWCRQMMTKHASESVGAENL